MGDGRARMTTKDNDTDPSTPSARRTNDVRVQSQLDDTEPGPVRTPLPPRPSTDPGVAPPPEPRQAPVRPMGIVVPVAAAPNLKKDSVELLLDGMTGAQPERTKTMPQTDGDASAAYHARHDVRAARTSPEEEPKVIIEKQALQATIRIDRSKIKDLNESLIRAGAMDPTAVLPPRIGRRIILAVAAGVAVVVGLFAALRLTGRLDANHPAPAAAAPRQALPALTTAAPAVATTAPSGLEPSPGSASALPSATAPSATPTESAHATTSAAPKARSAPSGSASAHPPKPKPAPSASATPDLGELKTTFH
jgi:hypothetical protein